MTRSDRPDKGRTTSSRALWLAFVFFIAVSFAALTLPDHPGAFSSAAFLRFPLEIPLMALALLVLPRRMAAVLSVLFALAVFTLLFLKIADIGVQSAFQRRFNPYLDMKMLADGWNVFSGTLGPWQAGLALGMVVAGFAGVLVLYFRAELRLIKLTTTQKRGTVIATLALLGIGVALHFAETPMRAEMKALPYLGNRLALIERSITDMRQFERDLVARDDAGSGDDLFAGIRGRDVILVFVESYGRSAVEDPLYSPVTVPRLENVESALAGAGFAAASGWLVSPTMGGLSWLAHGTFLSGLWTDSQARYDRLMISNRQSLNRLFRQAGWRTAAVMPAITMDWPEASYFGYDQVFAASDLGYRGKPFNWITMPDQYTLSAFERLARQPARASGTPLMAEIALISSHAPWTPVPRLISWNDVGDGTVFNSQAESGETPQTVWSNRDDIRDHYIRTIDYSLQTLGDYITRFGDDAVFIVLGDHQPAPIITGPDASRAVPVHVVSRDAALIGRFEADGFTASMIPARDAPEIPMDTIRARLVELFGQTSGPTK
ncbi:sulfatase-like hydrolase/transferase [Martelella soudanensis]|uniref:sulfatase-like hydrolase/transferase n=1 Tax=unclassified Martelella TaxID=2629616 RepID=UPI001FED9E5B|nr:MULTISPECIES: sulfatase-like hydrolase/transferase [unclassified Martelella]